MPHNNSPNKAKDIQRITLIGLLANVILTILKCLLGYLGNSKALIADGIHSLSDLATDIAILVGVKYWTAPADEKHPYGHHKVETIVTIIISFIIASAGIGIGYNAILTMLSDEPQLIPHSYAAIAAALSIVVKEVLYRFTVQQAEKLKSPSLKANAHHHRSDVYSSLPALIAVIAPQISPQLIILDSIGAVVVSLFILALAYELLKPCFSELVDSAAAPEEITAIKETVLAVEGVRSTHKIRTRRLGFGIYADLHIQVDGSMSVTNGHNISSDVKKALLNNGHDITDIVVHLEPYDQ